MSELLSPVETNKLQLRESTPVVCLDCSVVRCATNGIAKRLVEVGVEGRFVAGEFGKIISRCVNGLELHSERDGCLEKKICHHPIAKSYDNPFCDKVIEEIWSELDLVISTE